MDFSYGISVVMATYNTDISMLKEAVAGILDQTFKDFEFIIIDDASDNGSEEYLRSICDSRVKVVTNPHNLGITKSLNIGLKLATGKYIARMDADDISLPVRLEKEYDYMETHPDVVVCGTETADIVNGTLVNDHKKKQRPINMDEYRINLIFKNPGPIHPTVMLRHETLLANNISYDERLIHAQDYGMWETLSHYGRVHILDEILLHRRKHGGQITVARRDTQISCDKMTQKKILSALLGTVSDEEIDFHYKHSSGYFADAVMTPEAEAWYDRILQANKVRQIYDQRYLNEKIISIKKKLVVHSFSKQMTFGEKIRIITRYIPAAEGMKMVVGHVKRVITAKIKTGNAKELTW